MEWADKRLSKMLDGLDGWSGLDGYWLDCCDYYSPCSAYKTMSWLKTKKRMAAAIISFRGI